MSSVRDLHGVALLHNQSQFRGMRQGSRAGSEIAGDIDGVGSGLRVGAPTAAR